MYIYIYNILYFQGVRSRSRDISTSLSRTSSTKFLRLEGFKMVHAKYCKTDINSPGSTSQQERRQKRPLKAARNHRQACLNAETKEQRQAKLQVDRGTTAQTTSSSSKKTNSTARNSRGTNQEIGLSQEYYQHQFDFE